MKPWMISPQFETFFSKIDKVDFQNLASKNFATWLAKINVNAGLEGHVGLYRPSFSQKGKKILFPGQKFNKNNLAKLAKRLGISIVFIYVNHGKTTFGLRPYFFKSLNIYLPDGRTNTCHPGHLYDDPVQQALCSDHLGSGPGWENRNVVIPNWDELFKQGMILFFVWFNGELFIVVPENDQNSAISGITSDQWITPTLKKVFIGAGLAAGTAATLYGGYLLGKNHASILNSILNNLQETASNAWTGTKNVALNVGHKIADSRVVQGTKNVVLNVGHKIANSKVGHAFGTAGSVGVNFARAVIESKIQDAAFNRVVDLASGLKTTANDTNKDFGDRSVLTTNSSLAPYPPERAEVSDEIDE
jgi:hypothetical protein